MRNKGLGLLYSVIAAFLLTSCLEGQDFLTEEEILNNQLNAVDKDKLQSDLAIIDDSLADWNITPLIETNGVRYIINQAGSGSKPSLSSVVKVKYTGKFLSNGQIFDQGEFTYGLSNLIIGWKLVLPLLPKGTQSTLYIPSGFAYGPSGVKDSNGNTIIPPNSNLIFDIELVDIY